MTLQEQFINTFKNHNTITTKAIIEWYHEVKKGTSLNTYASAVYNLIVNPLINKNILTRVGKGLYALHTIEGIEEEEEKGIMDVSELDEFDLYIQNKMQQGESE